MSFLNPIALFGLFAIALPIIIHLLNRRRHRVVQWAAMQFLLKAARESRGKKRLKHIIILTCRALAIGALIFALARPLTSMLLGWGSGKVDTVILLLDRSASMEAKVDDIGPSKREAVLERAAKSIKELGGARLILIDSVSSKAQDVPSPDILPEITSVAPTDTSSNIAAMLSQAIEFMTEADTGRTEIWIASDLQKKDWAPEDGRWANLRVNLAELPEQTNVRILGLSNEPNRNINIRVTSAKRQGEDLVLDILVNRITKEGTITIPVTYSLDGASSTDTLTLSEQTIQYQKRFSVPGRKEGGSGWISIPADDNPRDNVSFFAYGADEPAQSYVVSDDPEAGGYLNLMTAPPSLKNFNSSSLTPDQVDTIDFTKASFIVWQAQLPDPTQGELLKSYIQQGGQVLFLPSKNESENSFLDMSWGELEETKKDEFYSIGEWERDDGPLRDGISNTEVPVRRLRAIQRRGISGTATSLAFWKDNKPAISRKIVARGEAIFCSTIPNYEWSNLGDGEILVPVIQRLIEEGQALLGSSLNYDAGSPEAELSSGEFRTRIDDFSEDSLNSPDQAGVYRNDEATFVLNRPVSEDDPVKINREEIGELLEDTNYSYFGEQAATSSSFVQEIWRPFLIAMLLFMIVEAILCLNPRRGAQSNIISARTKQTPA